MKKTSKRAVTLSDLASQMRAGFEDVKKYADAEIEGLARMTQEGFSGMDKSFKTAFSAHTGIVLEEFRRINADIKDMKTALLPIAGIVAKHEDRIESLESRVDHIEPSIGIVRLRR